MVLGTLSGEVFGMFSVKRHLAGRLKSHLSLREWDRVKGERSLVLWTRFQSCHVRFSAARTCISCVCRGAPVSAPFLPISEAKPRSDSVIGIENSWPRNLMHWESMLIRR